MVTYRLASPHSVMPHRLEHQYPGGVVRAVMTGQYRPPRAGEWFLSGACPEAYKAVHDLHTAYAILRLVLVREKKIEIILPLPEC